MVFTTDASGRIKFIAAFTGILDPGSNGVLTRTALGVAIARVLTAGSSKLTVTNGDGVAGNPTIDIGTLTAGDIPNLDASKITSGQFAPARGGVGASTVALVDGATPALDASQGTVFRLAAAGNRTIAVPTNPTPGQKIIIQHFASGGARTLSLNTGAGGFRFGTDITALTTTTSGKTDYIGAVYNDTDSKWDVVAVTKGF